MTSRAAMAVPRDRDGGSKLSDRQVIVVVCNGDSEAFAVLVDRYYGPLARHLAARVGDRDLAADLAQETFADAFRDLDTFTFGKATFAVWLYGIAHNRLRAHWRRQRVRRLVSLEWLTGSPEATPARLQQPDDSESCHEQVILSHVFALLTPPLRDALLLHSLNGFTAPEVAQILGISRGAAERRISRAKQQFRQRYHELNDEERGFASD